MWQLYNMPESRRLTLMGGRCKVTMVVEAGDAVNLNSLFATLYL